MKKAIFLSIALLGAVFVISAQTSDCDSLIFQIKEMAERHVDNNENMKTEFVVDLYKDNPCGLNRLQLAEIYESQYELIKKESTNKWIFRPKTDWIYLVLFFLLGISVKVIREWITTIFNNIGLFLYSKFSGSRIFRRKALKKYKNALFNTYKEVKITFRPGKPLNMADIFIPLKVIDNAENNQLEIEQAISLYEKTVVLGDPGSGKSMFCKNILFRYSKGKLEFDKIPVLVELHRLSDKALTIFTLLEKAFTNNDFPNASNFLTQYLKSGNLFILFDGYDEINFNERKRVADLINDFIKENNKCQYIITSRIAVYKDQFKDVTDKTLKLIDFDQQQIRKFLDSWDTEMPEGKSIEKLMKTLQERPNILRLATNPYILTMMTHLYTITSHDLPHSRSEFYRRTTSVLLDPKPEFEDKFASYDKSVILQHLALTSLEEAQDKQQDQKLLLYTKVIEEIKKILPKIGRPEGDVHAILGEIVERSGLLLAVDNGVYYQFAHFTMHEYFAAEQLREKQDELLNKFEKDRQTWREIIKLWCGLVNDPTKMIFKLNEIDPLIAFECIADAKYIESETADSIIAHFEKILLVPTQCNIEIEKAFGVLASDARSTGRGRKIFEMLKSKMESCKDKEQLLTIGNALSYTYRPEAATIISTQCFRNQELYNCLIRMGDIAIDELLILSNKNDLNALLGIKKISTPGSALALLSLILDDDKEINRYAAWFLADLVFKPNIIDALHKYKPTQTTLLKKNDDWAWQPFKTQDPSDTNLSFIIGRIVFLMSLPIEFKQEIDLKIDGRIGIPVIINQSHSVEKEGWKIINIHGLGLLEDEINLIKQLSKYNDSFSFTELLSVIKNFSLFEKEKQSKRLNDFLLRFINRKKYPIFYMISDFWRSETFKIFVSEKKFGTKLDWINLFRKDYEFNTSWHYQIIYILFTILTISSIIFCGYSLWHSEHFFTTWNIVQSIGGVIMIFSVIANKLFFEMIGYPKIYEAPDFLLKGGVFGFFTFPGALIIDISSKEKKIIDDSYAVLHGLLFIIRGPFLFYYNYLLLKCFLPLTSILMIATAIIGFCVLLAIYGNNLERKSKNPFKGLKEILLAKNNT